MNLIAEMWCYAELCSHDKQDSGDDDGDKRDFIADTIRVQLPRSLFLQMHNKLEYCYVVEEKDRIIVCFRGTGEIPAWINNFNVLPLVDGYMHQGFYDLIQYFGPEIDKVLKAIFDKNIFIKPVYITGHSLGGIMSQYYYKWLWDKHGQTSVCISFGSPVGGTKKWAEVVNAIPGKNYRVVNGYDLVTELADDTIGGHGGKLIRLPQPKWHGWFKWRQLLDHAYSSYTDALIKYCITDPEAVSHLKAVKKRVNI